jgi:hypothetical protein
VQRQVVPWRIKTDFNNGGMGMGMSSVGTGMGVGGRGNGNGQGFQSMVVDDRGYGSQECVAGPPYIPPRSPERAFGTMRKEFF